MVDHSFRIAVSGDLDDLRMSFVEHRDAPVWDAWYAGKSERGYFVLVITQDKGKLRAVSSLAISELLKGAE